MTKTGKESAQEATYPTAMYDWQIERHSGEKSKSKQEETLPNFHSYARLAEHNPSHKYVQLPILWNEVVLYRPQSFHHCAESSTDYNLL